MQNPFIHFVLLLFMQGVFGADETVTEGGSVTLHIGVTEIQNDDVIEWNFGPQNMFLCQITKKGDLTPISLTDDVGFRGRLQVDQKTGSLTIRNTRIRHSGQYKVTISSEQTTTKMFKVAVQSVVGESGGGKSVSVMEGGSITLQNDVKVQRDDLIVWRFGDKGVLLAKFDDENNKTSLNGSDERFRGRLKLDHQTGSLTITNTKTTDSGLYQLQITGRESSQQFLLSVKDSSHSNIYISICVSLVIIGVIVGFVVLWFLSKMMKNVSGFEGEPLKLTTDKKIGKDDKIEWRLENDVIAEVIRGNMFIYDDVPDERFRDRLQLEHQTGSLTITNIRTTDAGLYKLQINRKCKKKFKVSVSVEKVSVLEGDDVNLKTEKQKNDLILWHFDNTIISEIKGGFENPSVCPFRDRQKLNCQTGSLTITNTTIKDSGVYKLQITSGSVVSYKKFSVTVRKRIVPVIKEGDVTICTFTEIQRDDEIEWRFEKNTILIAQGNEGIRNTPETADERFSDLKLDKKTGSLTIKNIGRNKTGVYELKIRGNTRTIYKRFHATTYDGMERMVPGSPVTLRTDLTEMQLKEHVVQWQYGDNNSSIAEIKNGFGKISKSADERFRGKLKLDDKTGSLTILDIKTEHTGFYNLLILNNGRTTKKRFKVLMLAVPLSVMVGDDVTIHPNAVKQGDDQFLWMFGNQDSQIAEIRGGTGKTSDGPDGIFKDRLKLNEKTGSVTITNITTEHIGCYKLQISSSRGTFYKLFSISFWENQQNESATVMMPRLTEELPSGGNEQEGSSLL